MILRSLADIISASEDAVKAVCDIRRALLLSDHLDKRLDEKIEAARDALMDLSAFLHQAARFHEHGDERHSSTHALGRREGPDE